MASLRISLMPLEKAVQADRDQKEALLAEGMQLLEAQHIAGISHATGYAFQCVVWLKGSEEAIAQMRDYLTASRIPYERHPKEQTRGVTHPALD